MVALVNPLTKTKEGGSETEKWLIVKVLCFEAATSRRELIF